MIMNELQNAEPFPHNTNKEVNEETKGRMEANRSNNSQDKVVDTK